MYRFHLLMETVGKQVNLHFVKCFGIKREADGERVEGTNKPDAKLSKQRETLLHLLFLAHLPSS